MMMITAGGGGDAHAPPCRWREKVWTAAWRLGGWYEGYGHQSPDLHDYEGGRHEDSSWPFSRVWPSLAGWPARGGHGPGCSGASASLPDPFRMLRGARGGSYSAAVAEISRQNLNF